MPHPRFATHYAVETRSGGILAIFREKVLADLYAAGVKGRVLPWLLPRGCFEWDDEAPDPVAGDNAIAALLGKKGRESEYQ